MGADTETITSFYRAFQERDHAAMAACYHPAVHFSDPVFTDLYGDEAKAMWHMLCERGSDLTLTFSDVSAAGNRGSARWDATYTFGPSGRLVRNSIDASFVFEDTKIIRHVDTFDLWRWTRMALGISGVLTGWTGFTKAKVRATANRGLMRFIDDHPEYERSGRSRP